VIVNLTPSDIDRCRRAAQRRVNERLKAGAIKESEVDFHLTCHFSGTLGEYAVCKHYSCDWLGEYFEGKDWDNRTWDTAVGEVRATFRPGKDGGMRFYPNDDRPDAPYIWVNLRRFGYNKKNPIMIQAKLVGWAWQSDKKYEWWKLQKKYFVVPSESLRPMDTLPAQI
jgi:hypothetical protein